MPKLIKLYIVNVAYGFALSAVFLALCAPGDRVLGMSLDHGGHLSHGHPKNFSGVFYDFHSYGVEQETERIDMERVREAALEVKPRVLLAGASAYSRLYDYPRMRAVAAWAAAMKTSRAG